MSEKQVVYKKNRHSCYLLKYHLVVVTKYRHPVLTEEVSNRLYEITRDVFVNAWGCTVISMKTDQDHIHVLFEAPPQVQLSKLVNNYKTVSARLLRKEYANFLKKYYWKPFFWNRSYFIGCVSDVTEEIINTYINNQGKD
jgi:putative transposase